MTITGIDSTGQSADGKPSRRGGLADAGDLDAELRALETDVSTTPISVIPAAEPEAEQALRPRFWRSLTWHDALAILSFVAVSLFVTAPIEIAYYANSFVCRPKDVMRVTAWSQHEDDRFAAAVRCGQTVGVQFHPEKSSREGVALVRAFVGEARGRRALRVSLTGIATETGLTDAASTSEER